MIGIVSNNKVVVSHGWYVSNSAQNMKTRNTENVVVIEDYKMTRNVPFSLLDFR